MLVMITAKKTRRVKWNHEQINWQNHVEKLRHANGFQKRYHMSERSFNELVNLLRPQVSYDKKQAYHSTRGKDPIGPEMVVGAGLCFLGGDHVKSRLSAQNQGKSNFKIVESIRCLYI